MSSPNASESRVLSSSPPKPAPRTRMRFFMDCSTDLLFRVQTVGAQPLRVENPGHVAHARITQERDYHLTGTVFLGEAQRAGHVDSRREAGENPLLAQQLVDKA